MSIKKALAVALGIGALLTGSAFAQKGMGPKAYPPVDPAKLQEFCKEAQPLYQKKSQLRVEIRSNLLQPSPNWDAILEKEQELAKIRVEIMKKAYEKGLPLGRFGSLRKYCSI